MYTLCILCAYFQFCIWDVYLWHVYTSFKMQCVMHGVCSNVQFGYAHKMSVSLYILHNGVYMTVQFFDHFLLIYIHTLSCMHSRHTVIECMYLGFWFMLLGTIIEKLIYFMYNVCIWNCPEFALLKNLIKCALLWSNSLPWLLHLPQKWYLCNVWSWSYLHWILLFISWNKWINPMLMTCISRAYQDYAHTYIAYILRLFYYTNMRIIYMIMHGICMWVCFLIRCIQS